MPKIFVARKIPDVGLTMLSSRFEVDVWQDSMPPPREALIERAKGCEGILSLLSDSIDGSVMDAIGRQLKGIANFAVGYNNIDVAAAQQRNIQVGNTPDVLTDATADVAVGLLIAAARHFQPSIDQVRQLAWKTWEPLGLLGQDLHGKKLGILGMGRIGQAVAKRMRGGWEMEILYSARTDKPEVDGKLGASRVDWETLLRESDFLSVHTDLNPKTKHLLNESAFEQMKPNAVLINTSRGGVVDQDALYQALLGGKIFAAGLDVTDPEPLPENSLLRELPNCIILPHIGSATHQARDAMSRMAAQNLIDAIEGRRMSFQVK